MNQGPFSLYIQGGTEDSDGYVSLKHKQTYQVVLTNNQNRACDVMLEIDGKNIGTFRVYPFSSSTIERSPDDRGKFTFLKTKSVEGRQAELEKVSKNDRGVVKATFKPEREAIVRPVSDMLTDIRPVSYTKGRGPCGQSVGESHYDMCFSPANAGGQHTNSIKGFSKYESGGTGLTGHSNQNFRYVNDLNYADASEFVTIVVRLVGKKKDLVRPLRPRTRVPKPVD